MKAGLSNLQYKLKFGASCAFLRWIINKIMIFKKNKKIVSGTNISSPKIKKFQNHCLIIVQSHMIYRQNSPSYFFC